MTTVNYLTKSQMTKKFGMPNALGYTKDGKIYIRKGLDKKTERVVREHEADHVAKGEEGPFLGAVIGAGASLLGGMMGNNATQDAANTTAQSADVASRRTAETERRQMEELQRQYELSRQDTLPYRYTGVNALNFLNQALLPGGYSGYVDPDIVNTPNYLQPVRYGPEGVKPQPDSKNGNSERMRKYGKLTGFGDPLGLVASYNPKEFADPLGILGIGGSWMKSDPYVSSYTPGQPLPAQDRPNYTSQGGGGVTYDENGNVISGGSIPYLGPTQFTPGEFKASPDYQFRLDEGNKGIQNYLSANKMRLSGRALKEANRYNSNMASGEYGNWWNRALTKYQEGERSKENYLSRIFQMAGFGPQGVNTAVGAGQTYAGNAANVMGNASNAINQIQGQNAINQANLGMANASNWNNAIQSGISNYLTYQQQQNMMNMFNRPSYSGWGGAYAGGAAGAV